MINGYNVLAIIPARGGSKTIPGKNLKLMAGKPLIAWTIEEALQSAYIDRLIVSSENEEIIKVAKEWGCEVPFIRPIELAQDDTPGIATVIHAIHTIREKYDYIVLLQPTSPLRTLNDIDECICYCIQQDAPVCVSVCEVNKSPYWMHTLSDDKRLCPLMPASSSIERRQDLPRIYAETGAIYVAKTEYLLKAKNFITKDTVAYIMPANRSWDIDNEVDFSICNFLKTACCKR